MTAWAAACLSSEEWADWLARNPTNIGRETALRPCDDCGLGFAAEMRLVNRCNGTPLLVAPDPQPGGRPRLPVEDAYVARRRAQYRNAKARRRGDVPERVPVAAGRAPVRACVRLDEDAFWARVDRSAGADGCWPWQGNRNEQDYGRFTESGHNRYAHRRALEIKLGRAIEPGLGALHTCDNPPCCNPRHLYEGTAADNRADCVRRGRAWSNARLARRDVELIRTTPLPISDLIPMFPGVSIRTLYRARSGEGAYAQAIAS